MSKSMGPPVGLRGMRDKNFLVCGIRDLLQNFAGQEIQIEQTSFGMRDKTKSNCGMQEMT